MAGILLPARLFFVQYVSDNWLGSLGIISLITFVIIFLAKKNRLGFFGPMLEKQIFKFQKGKRGYVVFAESVFLLFLLGGMIFAIEQGNSVYSDLQMHSTSNSHKEVLESTQNWSVLEWITGFLMIPMAFLTAFPEMCATIASLDKKMDGWLLHFYTVGFVEYLELLGLLIFYKFYFRKKHASFHSQHFDISKIWNHRE